MEKEKTGEEKSLLAFLRQDLALNSKLVEFAESTRQSYHMGHGDVGDVSTTISRTLYHPPNSQWSVKGCTFSFMEILPRKIVKRMWTKKKGPAGRKDYQSLFPALERDEIGSSIDIHFSVLPTFSHLLPLSHLPISTLISSDEWRILYTDADWYLKSVLSLNLVNQAFTRTSFLKK